MITTRQWLDLTMMITSHTISNSMQSTHSALDGFRRAQLFGSQAIRETLIIQFSQWEPGRSLAIDFHSCYYIYFAFCLKPLTNKGGEETRIGLPGENSRRRALENAKHHRKTTVTAAAAATTTTTTKKQSNPDQDYNSRCSSNGTPFFGGLFVGCLLAWRPSNMLVYVKDGIAQTIVRATTLRQKLKIRLSVSTSHSIPGVALTFEKLRMANAQHGKKKNA